MASGGTVVARYESERAFHDALAEGGGRRRADRFYAVNERSWKRFRRLLLAEAAAIGASRPPDILEYGSGAGAYASTTLAEASFASIGIDISSASIRAARERAERIRGGVRPMYLTMNAEHLEFGEGAFDLVCGNGILHHLDLERALGEIARVLRPGGAALFAEPLGHNPLINLYRRLTPSQRTSDEHPLRAGDIELARRYFGRVDASYFHLFELLAVPIRHTPLFEPVRRTLGVVDAGLFRIVPPLRRQAWFVVLRLAEPRS
jgi:SAM-dependent methyltransferase